MTREGKLAVARQLATPPMRLFARWIEHALDVAVQCPHDPDAREHRWPVVFCNDLAAP